MTRYYVKFKNGVLLSTPKVISGSETETPNTSWSKDQMKLNDFFEVDINFDPLTETIDLLNPVVSGESVIYQRTQKSDLYIVSSVKSIKISQMKKDAQELVFEKHPVYKQLSASLGLYDSTTISTIKNSVKKMIDYVNLAESEINSKTTRAEVENYIISFPSI